MTELTYPRLNQFFGGYFHQFWKEVLEWKGRAPNFEEVVRLFLKEASGENVDQAVRELKQLINRKLDEDELRGVLIRLGSCFRAPGLDMTYQEWLEAILGILLEESS